MYIDPGDTIFNMLISDGLANRISDLIYDQVGRRIQIYNVPAPGDEYQFQVRRQVPKHVVEMWKSAMNVPDDVGKEQPIYDVLFAPRLHQMDLTVPFTIERVEVTFNQFVQSVEGYAADVTVTVDGHQNGHTFGE